MVCPSGSYISTFVSPKVWESGHEGLEVTFGNELPENVILLPAFWVSFLPKMVYTVINLEGCCNEHSDKQLQL